MFIDSGITIGQGIIATDRKVTYDLNYLLVAGGGGGGTSGGVGAVAGSGGAGGIVSGTVTVSYLFRTAFTCLVGAGGSKSQNGGNTIIGSPGWSSVRAIGGGKGGDYSESLGNGSSGGSGGGGSSATNPSYNFQGGTGLAGQGSNGGRGSSFDGAQAGFSDGIGSGGGGGSDLSTSLNGGDGSSYYSALLSAATASGTSVGVNVGGTYYIAGGGGGVGGKGGGGVYGGNTITRNGIAYTGSGGSPDNSGGMGVVLLYYTNPTQIIQGTATSSGTGNSKVWYHAIKNTGGFVSLPT